MKPKLVAQEDYDFIMSFRDPLHDGLFGIMGEDLMVSGHATKLDGTSFDFEADLLKFLIDIQETPETDAKVLSFNEKAMKFEAGSFQALLGEVRLADGTELCTGMESLIHSSVEDLINAEYTKLWEGDKSSLQNLPVESMMPILFLKHVSSIAKDFEVTPEFIEYGIDPDTNFGRSQGQASAKKQKMLKEIESKFSERLEGQDENALSFIFDENFINTYLLEFVMIDKSMSLEKYLMMDPRTKPIAKNLSTVIFK